MLLENKIAVVTGAGRGIGRGIALALAREGAMVVVNYNGSKERAEEVVNTIEQAGGNAVAIQCNVSDFEAAKEFYAGVVKEYGKIDILVNNAGITKDNLMMKMSEDEFQSVIQTNLAGTFHGVKFVTRPMMKQRQGRIINIASVSGVTGNMGQANYSASKAGVIGLTKAAAKELASRNITVNAVAPGFIATEMTDVLSDSVKESAVATIPLGHFGEVEDIAETVVFLASDKAKYITGQVICVDGGIAM
ncbi:MAG: 3-oxoacyl-[acyl-carrier-protein] reductase [Clostridiales bacterium]|nr:3-oxoacyl-[acyl-carrier-protein] reductase [Eubacterium sp.]MDD7350001.1 3-oxoacyl-[acyl-carrier-protein] reductase [Clostridiales bacterium]MDY3775250.1 3-oxoacyl-[acyl-carrier-protein] reductase [Eubacterium sp.]